MTGVETGRHRQPPAARACPAARHCAPGKQTAWTTLADWSVSAVPAVLGLATGGYHEGVPPLWRDEAATKAIAGRSVGQILATMMRTWRDGDTELTLYTTR